MLLCTLSMRLQMENGHVSFLHRLKGSSINCVTKFDHLHSVDRESQRGKLSLARPGGLWTCWPGGFDPHGQSWCLLPIHSPSSLNIRKQRRNCDVVCGRALRLLLAWDSRPAASRIYSCSFRSNGFVHLPGPGRAGPSVWGRSLVTCGRHLWTPVVDAT